MKLTPKKLGTFLARKLAHAHKDTVQSFLKDFVEILRSKRLLSKKSEIIRFFTKEWNTIHNTVDVEILTASHKEAPHIESVGKKKAEVIIKEDAKLIAGSKITVGDYLFDTSLQSKISNLKK